MNFKNLALSLSALLPPDIFLTPGRIDLGQVFGGARSALISLIHILCKKNVVVFSQEAQQLYEEIKSYVGAEHVHFLPSWDTFPTEDISPSSEIIGQRMEIFSKLSKGHKGIFITNIKSALTSVFPEKELKKYQILISKTKPNAKRDDLISTLVKIGYKRRDIVGERGEFSARGGILDIFPSHTESSVRIEYIGDDIESIRYFDPATQRSIKMVDEISVYPIHEIVPDSPEEYTDGIEAKIPYKYPDFSSLFDYLDKNSIICTDNIQTIELDANRFIKEVEEIRQSPGKYYLTPDELNKKIANFKHIDLTIEQTNTSIGSKPPESYNGKIDGLIGSLRNNGGKSHIIVSKQADRLYEMLLEEGLNPKKVESLPENVPNSIYVLFGQLYEGFALNNISLLTDKELFGKAPSKIKMLRKPVEGVSKDMLADLKSGDYIVHDNYGIGIYKGIVMLEVGGSKQEYVEIHYADEDTLYVPPHQMGLIGKYSGTGDYHPKLSRLGGKDWLKVKGSAKKAIHDMTIELIDLYSNRQKETGYLYPPDSHWQMELEKSFPYDETPDQAGSIRVIKKEMEKGQLIDRLVCGDVGYGKTEVALRVAFKTIQAGKQVAMLTPTTILAEQHYKTFSARFSPFPVHVEMLSRFRTKEEQRSIIKDLELGSIDMVIGTHRLLQKDIKFKDLGLVIVDEEQKFGVSHKEKLKILAKGVNIITLSATPIPRTLYMSLSGIREMSLISTPPLDRSPVRTYLRPWDEGTIKEVILRELERGGQVFFVHNFVKSIDKIASIIQGLIPKARIAVAHGQMDEKSLEEIMTKFTDHEYDILISTSIIESGLDIPSVNTVIIDNADNFGLSQLYQIRGRVGRSSTRAFAYLLYHKEKVLTDLALERLKAIQEFTALGSGYKLAMADLEIRGAGNVLGAQQSGHLLNIGFDMYCDMLEDSVREIKNIPVPTSKKVIIDLKVDAYIPKEYVTDERQRIALYKRMNLINSMKELKDMELELKDRFGNIPEEAGKLVKLIEIKLIAGDRSVVSIVGDQSQVTVTLSSNKRLKITTKGLSQNKWMKLVHDTVEGLTQA